MKRKFQPIFRFFFDLKNFFLKTTFLQNVWSKNWKVNLVKQLTFSETLKSDEDSSLGRKDKREGDEKWKNYIRIKSNAQKIGDERKVRGSSFNLSPTLSPTSKDTGFTEDSSKAHIS